MTHKKVKKRYQDHTKTHFSNQEKRVVKRLWKLRSRTPLVLFRIKSIFNALHGIGFSAYSQRNFQIHIVIGLLVISSGVYFKISTQEWIFLTISIFFVLVAEAFNTAIEVITDMITKKRQIRAMLAKDIAAGAVFLSVINAVIIGYLIFFDKIVSLIQGGIN